jgi:cobalt-precorrin-6B (C15)-methyltransferase
MNDTRQYFVPGIPDSQFRRGTVPMTKEEVRALTICRMRPAEGLVVWDVGAGTGSLSVEAALLSPGGHVFAVERQEEGVRLINENCRLFGVEDRVTVVTGTAPAALEGLPSPDRVIVGGSGGRLREILALCAGSLKPGGIVVVNAVLPATLQTSLEVLSLPPFTGLEAIHVQISRLVEPGWAPRAQNAVWIISAKKEA